jgi:hypothetical protein
MGSFFSLLRGMSLIALLGSDENGVAGFARPHSVRKTATPCHCAWSKAKAQNPSPVILRERAESLNAVCRFPLIPSPLAGEDGLQSKHGEGSLFLKMLLPFSSLSWSVIARARCRPWQSRN